MSPIWNPEFFGNTMVVNGRTWPFLEVEPRRYRFRFLNGCNSRFLILKLVTDPLGDTAGSCRTPLLADRRRGRLPARAGAARSAPHGPAERADVIVDFTGLPIGTEIYLINEGPDEPFGGGVPGVDFDPADPATTGQVMKFVVVPLASKDQSQPPRRLTLPALQAARPAEQYARRSRSTKRPSSFPGFDGPVEALLGTLDGEGIRSRSAGTIPSPRTRP